MTSRRANSAPAPVSGALASSDFSPLVPGVDDPPEVARARAAAWKRFSALPWPTKKSEAWRYTDLSAVDFGALTPVLHGAARAAAADGDGSLPEEARGVLARSGDRSGVVVLRDGQVSHIRLEPEAASEGIVLCSIRQAAESHPDLLRHALFEADPAPAEEKLWSLHIALLGGGFFLHVPRGVKLGAPVHAFHILERSGTLSSSHSFVHAEEGARAAVVDEFLTGGAAGEGDAGGGRNSRNGAAPRLDSVSLHGASVTGDAGSVVEYVSLQRFGPGVRHFSTQHVEARNDSRLVTFNVALGGELSRADVTSLLAGPGSDSQMLALWFGDSAQHFDHHTLQHHAAPHAHSDLLFKGALADKGSSVFRGLIRVDKGAQLTDAYQTNRNLLLSKQSRASALPNLEIEADDVRCSHGATIGQVEDGQIFYLMSRGLTRGQAERLLVFGFFEEVLARLPLEGVRERVRTAIEEKIGL